MGALCEMRCGITRVGRLSVVLGAWLAAGPIAGAGAQEAQWWESIPGFGKQGSSYRTTSEERRKPEVLNDLRPDATPFRSEAMIGALEGAIARYQDIVANGGWPAIPRQRMLRPEDDGESVPLLSKRLGVSGGAGGAQRKGVSVGIELGET